MKPNHFERALIHALLLALTKEGLLSFAVYHQAEKKLYPGGKPS